MIAALLLHQTQDGTAIAGTDYTAASGSIVIPAGTATGLNLLPSLLPNPLVIPRRQIQKRRRVFMIAPKPHRTHQVVKQSCGA
jgi:hypothetical protein